MSLFDSLKSVAGGVVGGVQALVTGHNPFSGSAPKPSSPLAAEPPTPATDSTAVPSPEDRAKSDSKGGYKSYSDLPWWERTVLNVGSGVESVGKKAAGIVGLDEYAPSTFTDEKNKIKSDIEQKGYSKGWDWDAFGKGSAEYKVYDKLFNDHPTLSESIGSSLEMGSGISGGGQQNAGGMGDDLPGRLGMQSGGSSLGKRMAIQEDPALKDENYNRNNFNF